LELRESLSNLAGQGTTHMYRNIQLPLHLSRFEGGKFQYIRNKKYIFQYLQQDSISDCVIQQKMGGCPGFEPGTCYNYVGRRRENSRNNNHTTRPTALERMPISCLFFIMRLQLCSAEA
jgi:hypothetical protein